jgi:uncharacterized protein YgbK (DUF1537 family)
VTPGILVIAGSAAPEARAQLERLAEAGAQVLTLTREAVLTQDETLLMALRSAAGAALKQGRHVVVRSENWPGAAEITRRLAAKRFLSAQEVERRVSTMLARVAEGVVKAGAARRLVTVGSDTGEALWRHLGLTKREVVGEVATGLSALLVDAAVGSGPLLLVRKPGRSGEPDTLLQAVLHLAAMDVA